MSNIQKSNEFLKQAYSNTPVETTTNNLPKPEKVSPRKYHLLSESPVLINCDWFSCMFSDVLDPRLFTDGILEIKYLKLELLAFGTSQFKYLANVYHEGDKFGQICFDARQKTLQGKMLFKLDNHILYNNAPVPFYLDAIKYELETSILNITRFDIAVDGVKMLDFIDDLSFTDKYVKLKTKKNFAPTAFDLTSKKFKGFTTGARSGDKFAICYNKSKEIRDNDNKKGYILDFWKANGLDVSEDVYRLELRLKSVCFKDIDFKVNDYNLLFEPEILYNLFMTHQKNFLEWVPAKSSDSVINRRPRILLFPIPKMTVIYQKIKKELFDKVRSTKIVIKKLLKESWLTDILEESTFFLTRTASHLLSRYNLWDWLSQKEEYYIKEFRKEATLLNKVFIDERQELGLFGFTQQFKGVTI